LLLCYLIMLIKHFQYPLRNKLFWTYLFHHCNRKFRFAISSSSNLILTSRRINSFSGILLRAKKEAENEHEIPIKVDETEIIAKLLASGEKEMQNMSQVLVDELSRHFSLRVDLKTYEDMPVKLENGETRKMSQLGRISLRNQNTIAINFSDNPSVVKQAKTTLENVMTNSNIVQEGFLLFIQIPKITRQHREHLVQRANSKIINDYKRCLNQVYCKYDRLIIKQIKNKSEEFTAHNNMLAEKKRYEKFGSDKLKEWKEIILKEIV